MTDEKLIVLIREVSKQYFDLVAQIEGRGYEVRVRNNSYFFPRIDDDEPTKPKYEIELLKKVP